MLEALICHATQPNHYLVALIGSNAMDKWWILRKQLDNTWKYALNATYFDRTKKWFQKNQVPPLKCCRSFVHQWKKQLKHDWNALKYSRMGIHACYIRNRTSNFRYECNWVYFKVNCPRHLRSSKTLKTSGHKCFSHFPRSSECSVSYEDAA